jgi:hypothetical protein
MRFKWRLVAALGVLAMFASACSTASSSKSSGSTPGTGSTGPLTASARGVTADSIRIGFSYPDLAALAKTGIIKVDSGPFDQVMKVLVNDVNKHGGVDGRKLDLFLTKYDVLGNTAQLAGCTQLTEDDKVFIVLGGFIGANNLCVTQQHATPLISGYGTGFNGAALAQAHAPWFTWNASDERATQALVQILAQQGRLKNKTIAVEGQTPDSKSLVDLAVKELGKAGYKAADTAIIDAQASDQQAFTAQDKLLAQRFKDKGADVLILLGGTPTGTDYDAVGWHPSIYVPQTDLVTPGAYTSPYSKFPFVGGLAPTADPDAGYNTPAMKHCREVWTQATGKVIKTVAQETADGKSSGNGAMLAACTSLEMFIAGAKAAGANLTPQTWATGLESVGKMALPYRAIASFGPNKPDGQDSFILEQHDPKWTPTATTSEFIPIGQPITLR